MRGENKGWSEIAKVSGLADLQRTNVADVGSRFQQGRKEVLRSIGIKSAPLWGRRTAGKHILIADRTCIMPNSTTTRFVFDLKFRRISGLIAFW